MRYLHLMEIAWLLSGAGAVVFLRVASMHKHYVSYTSICHINDRVSLNFCNNNSYMLLNIVHVSSFCYTAT